MIKSRHAACVKTGLPERGWNWTLLKVPAMILVTKEAMIKGNDVEDKSQEIQPQKQKNERI